MPRHLATLLLVGSLSLTGGCGQMGPLYMPPPEATQAPAPEPAAEQPQSAGTP